ncbi:chymotrypsinogen B-like [Amblyomma americanum]
MIPPLFRVNLLLLCILTAVLAQEVEVKSFDCGVSSLPKLIVNGSTAKPRQFPWMVRLTVWFTPSLSLNCGGSIITRRHVLTAAHCVVIGRKKAIRVQARYGTIHRKQGRTVESKDVLPHPLYKTSPMAYDIAVLLLKKPFQYSNYARQVCLPKGIMNVVNRNVVVSGWGLQKRARSDMDYLQYTVLKVQASSMCKVYGPHFSPYTMLCAFKRGTGTCAGDSGGPVATRVKNGRFVQLGIVSYGAGHDCTSLPKVFTRVDVLMPWIRQQTKNERLYTELSSDDTVMDSDSPLIPYSFWSDGSVYEPAYFPM